MRSSQTDGPARVIYGKLRFCFFRFTVNSFPLFVGLRYTRSRQRTRFISVISLISVVGITLGMTVLITVLSVFNGFQREVRTRMLSAVAHVQVTGLGEALRDRQGFGGPAGAAKGLCVQQGLRGIDVGGRQRHQLSPNRTQARAEALPPGFSR